MAGPLRGKWWSPFSRGKVLRYLTGSYEPEQVRYFLENLNTGATVFDIGANLGYYTLLFSQCVGETGRVVAFEPSPQVVHFLNCHVRANRLTNVDIVQAAAGATSGRIRFDTQSGSGTGRVTEAGESEVEVCRLDEKATEMNVWPDFLKVDVEGFAGDVLAGASEILSVSRPTIYLSLHGKLEKAQCTEVLKRHDYQFHATEDGELICQRLPVRSKHVA